MESGLEALTEALRGSLKQAVICLSHSWGGLEQVAASDALDLGESGLNVQLVCLEGSPIHEQVARRREITVIPLNFRPRNYFDLNMRGEVKCLLAGGVNLFHSHQTSILGSLVPWLWSRRDVALFASRHIMNDHDERNPFHGALYSRLDSLLVMSQALKRNVLETHSLRERQVKVVNLGLDFDRFDPDKVDPEGQRALWGVSDPETVVIGLVGRIDPAKGQGTFIKAAAGLLKSPRKGEKIKFVIVGEETLGSKNAYLEELKAMVKQFRVEENVVFAGYQENIPEVMRGFDVVVMPSRQEAFGLVAIEAMAMECPIVISNGGSASEIVGNNEFGLTVRPDDAFDLQKQLRHLLDNPMERVQMGQRAREHVKKHYDRRRRLEITLELYVQALRRRGML
jgi:L-malate glycosyltransferase